MKVKSDDASIGVSKNSKKSVVKQVKREITMHENKLKIIVEEKLTVRSEIGKVFENSVERLVSTLDNDACPDFSSIRESGLFKNPPEHS